MKKTHRILAYAAAAAMVLGSAAQALEPALDPLPDLSAYPTQLLVDGQAVEEGAMPRYLSGTVLLPLRNILEQAGYTVEWDSQAQGAAFSLDSDGAYLLHMADGTLTLDGKTLWTDPKAVVLEGTTYVSADLFDYVEGVSANWDGATNTAVVTTDAPRDNVYCYDLGEGTLTQGKREIPYRMQGVIGVPEGENCPVVIFLHGSHPIQSAAENRYDLGFSYLVTPLSSDPVDVPVGIIIPQYDGDVTSLDGGTLFDQLENTPQRSSGTDLIYLENGNHGGFSTALVRPDPFADRETLPQVMAPEKQQAFFSAYVQDFVKSVLETGKTPLETDASMSDQYDGYPVMARVDASGTVLYRAAAESVQSLQTSGVTAEAVNACSTLDHTAGSFRIPGTFTHYDLTRLSWDSSGASVTIPMSADLKKASYLQLDLAQDSGDARNRQQDQSLTVTLRDAVGNESSVRVEAGTPALTWQEGTVETIPVAGQEDLLQYSTFTPLGTLRLDTATFTGVDLGRITQVTLTFDQPSGSIMLREIQTVA